MAAARYLVVVGGADASTTDVLADALRDEFAVRTAYSEAGLFASLDDDVDVVLVDPRLPDFDASRLSACLRERDLDCQVGVVTDDRAETVTDARHRAALADAFVATPSEDTDGAWRNAVSRLAARARYRKRLEEYYRIADEYATLVVDAESTTGDDGADEDGEGEPAESQTDRADADATGQDPADGEPANEQSVDEDAAVERERLADSLDRLQAALADAYDDLDADSLFDVVIDPWQGAPPPWRDSAASENTDPDDESP